MQQRSSSADSADGMHEDEELVHDDEELVHVTTACHVETPSLGEGIGGCSIFALRCRQ